MKTFGGLVSSRPVRAHGVIVLVAAISPSRASREFVRSICPEFIEVYVNAPLEVCERRDVKGSTEERGPPKLGMLRKLITV